MTADDKKLLDEIKGITQSIFESVNAGNWADINNIEQYRQELLDNFFKVQIAVEDSYYVAEIFQFIIETNHKVTTLLEKNKLQLTQEFNQFKSSQKATHAYLSNL